MITAVLCNKAQKRLNISDARSFSPNVQPRFCRNRPVASFARQAASHTRRTIVLPLPLLSAQLCLCSSFPWRGGSGVKVDILKLSGVAFIMISNSGISTSTGISSNNSDNRCSLPFQSHLILNRTKRPNKSRFSGRPSSSMSMSTGLPSSTVRARRRQLL